MYYTDPEGSRESDAKRSVVFREEDLLIPNY